MWGQKPPEVQILFSAPNHDNPNLKPILVGRAFGLFLCLWALRVCANKVGVSLPKASACGKRQIETKAEIAIPSLRSLRIVYFYLTTAKPSLCKKTIFYFKYHWKYVFLCYYNYIKIISQKLIYTKLALWFQIIYSLT